MYKSAEKYEPPTARNRHGIWSRTSEWTHHEFTPSHVLHRLEHWRHSRKACKEDPCVHWQVRKLTNQVIYLLIHSLIYWLTNPLIIYRVLGSVLDIGYTKDRTTQPLPSRNSQAHLNSNHSVTTVIRRRMPRAGIRQGHRWECWGAQEKERRAGKNEKKLTSDMLQMEVGEKEVIG